MDANGVHQHAASQTADDRAFAEGIHAQQQIAMALIYDVLAIIVCWLVVITVFGIYSVLRVWRQLKCGRPA